MPRPLGGKRSASPASKPEFSDFVSSLAVAFGALLLSLTVLLSAAQAASDDAPDTEVFDEEAAAAALAVKSGAPAQGGLTVEGLIYQRSDLETVPFTTAGSGDLVDSSELDGDSYTPGIRASLQGTVFDQPFELSAFYLVPIGSDLVRVGLTNTDMAYWPPTIPTANPIFPNSTQSYGIVAHHETKLFGAEANLVRAFGIPGLIVGARAIDFGEHLVSTAMNNADDYPPLGTDNDRDHASIRMDNRLLGVQFGLQHMFDVGDVMRIGGSIKGGLYGNFVDRNMSLIAENRVDRNWEATAHDTVFAQGVELNPRVELKLAEGTYLTASGQFLWLNNVGTALPYYAGVGQLDLADVRADDDVFFYGGSLGLTIALDQSSPISNSLPPFAYGDSDMSASGASAIGSGDIDERVAELEESTVRKGNSKVSFSMSGWINRMALFWDDGAEKDVYLVDNTASRSRINFNGAAQIARGWSAGYLLSFGFDVASANDVNQFITNDDSGIAARQSAWWIRSSQLGMVTLGLASTATDNIILKDVGGIMPGAANIATIGGSFIVRRAEWYEQGDGALETNAARTVDTTLNDFSAGASVDTLRRNIVRYDAPRMSGQWGNVDLSVAWGEDDFVDAAIEHGINYNDWKIRFGAGYLHDTSEGRIVAGHPEYFRDRREYKGSASILHIPTGLFATAAYVHRTFHGLESTDAPAPGAVYGENTAGIVTPDGTNRPPIDYIYSAFGLRRQYWAIGDTSVYGEFAQVDDAITGLHEAGMSEVTDSSLQMFGAAICQDIDDAGMDVYAGFRIYQFDTEGAQRRNASSNPIAPAPLTDMVFGYTGARIKF
jgi:hypothetical protein